jgi:hypothetical protein
MAPPPGYTAYPSISPLKAIYRDNMGMSRKKILEMRLFRRNIE